MTYHGPAIELTRVCSGIVSVVGGSPKKWIVANNKCPCGSGGVHGICDEGLLLVDVCWVGLRKQHPLIMSEDKGNCAKAILPTETASQQAVHSHDR